jgi:hypothetical protein
LWHAGQIGFALLPHEQRGFLSLVGPNTRGIMTALFKRWYPASASSSIGSQRARFALRQR